MLWFPHCLSTPPILLSSIKRTTLTPASIRTSDKHEKLIKKGCQWNNSFTQQAQAQITAIKMLVIFFLCSNFLLALKCPVKHEQEITLLLPGSFNGLSVGWVCVWVCACLRRITDHLEHKSNAEVVWKILNQAIIPSCLLPCLLFIALLYSAWLLIQIILIKRISSQGRQRGGFEKVLPPFYFLGCLESLFLHSREPWRKAKYQNNAAVMYIQVRSEGATMRLKLQKIILG